jgi:ubiquinone/menaquinone biosynthesis C-methylase UbiE
MRKSNAENLAKLQIRRYRSRRDFFRYQFEGASNALNDMLRYTKTDKKELLDLGCGYGGASVRLALSGVRVTAVDNHLYDVEFLSDAKKFAREKNAFVKFCAADAHDLPFKDESFDIIRLDSAIEHFDDPESAISECRRVIRPGGILFISFPLFFSPYGGHIFDYIKIPWFHLLPAPLVCGTIRQCSSKPGLLTTEYVEKLYMSLNKMTLKKYRTLIAANKLKEIGCEETFFMPHDATLAINNLKAYVSNSSHIKGSDKKFNFSWTPLMVFVFLYFLYKIQLQFGAYFKEFTISGIRSVVKAFPEQTDFRAPNSDRQFPQDIN